MRKISKGYKNFFNNFKDNCEGYCNKGFKSWKKWPIFCLLTPGKIIALIAILLTLLFCGVGFYGLLVIILLVLLFIFVP